MGLLLVTSIMAFGEISIGNMEKELIEVGISKDEIDTSKQIIDEAMKRHRVMLIEKEQKELEINKLIIEDPDKNWFRISKLFDEIGQLSANLQKNRLKAQIEVRKHIPKQKYLEARDKYIESNMTIIKKQKGLG
jgi:hypothetical protein